MTQSRLTIGTPKIPAKPPRGKPPCTEPIKYGSNILKDPGFELHVANTGGGPLGDEIPAEYWRPSDGFYLRDRQNMNWTDGTIAVPASTGWRATRNGDVSGTSYRQGWFVSSANPRTGTYHLRSAEMDDTAAWDVGPIYVHGVTACDGHTDPFYASRINGGDFFRWSLWAMVNIPGETYIRYFSASFYKADGSFAGGGIASPSENTFLTANYTEYVLDGFAPAGSYFLRLVFEPFATDSPVSVHTDVDDCVLEVS